MINLDDYLNYLNEGIIDVAAKVAKPLGKIIATNTKQALVWAGALATATATLKSLKLALSGSARKCGAGILKKETPGVKICIAKEKIKILQQQQSTYRNLLSKCNSNKNPQLCKENCLVKIKKIENEIEINKSKIKDYSNVNEQFVKNLASVGSLALGLAVYTIVDKAIFLMNRTFSAALKEEIRKCGIYEQGAKRNLCISKSKFNILTKKLQKLKSLNLKCNQEKNPEKCRQKMSKYIEKTNRQLEIEKDSITSYKNEIENQEREKRLKKAMNEQ